MDAVSRPIATHFDRPFHSVFSIGQQKFNCAFHSQTNQFPSVVNSATFRDAKMKYCFEKSVKKYVTEERGGPDLVDDRS